MTNIFQAKDGNDKAYRMHICCRCDMPRKKITNKRECVHKIHILFGLSISLLY